jgi:malate synthase
VTVGAAVVCASLLSTVTAAWGGSAVTSRATTQPAMRWGAHVRPSAGQSETEAVQALEQQLGRKLGADREFRLWDQPFPTSYDTWLRDTDHLVLLSVKPALLNGTKIPWRSIADAPAGSDLQDQIIGWAQRIKAWRIPIEFTFHHEPEVVGAIPYGTDADFIAAWRHVVDTFRAQGVTNARYLWITTDYGYDTPTTDRRNAPKWYPGDAWVDDMAVDAYNWYQCRAGISTPWKSLATIIENFRRFGALHPDKRLWLAEWASADDPADPTRKAQWIADARTLFKQPAYDQFDGVSMFDHMDGNFPSCNWRIGTPASTLDATRGMGADVFYRAGLDAQPK